MSSPTDRFDPRTSAARLAHRSAGAVRRIRPRSDATGLRKHTLWGLYALAAAPLVTAWSLTSGLRSYADAPALAAIVLAGVLTACFAFLAVRIAPTLRPSGSAAPAAWLRGLSLLGLCAAVAGWVVLAFTVIADAGARLGNDIAVAVGAQVTTMAGVYLCAILAVTLSMRWLWPIAVAAGALTYLAQAGEVGTHDPRTAALTATVAALGVAALLRGEMWYLHVATQLDERRETEARLAVAEERLRFSRDLHDVVGQALSAIAIKSEIGAELARRGDERAADVMAEVRALAQDSLREARGVVSGYRRADVATEIVGARALLASAGTATTVLGNPAALPDELQETFAWVTREAVTNVVRHARATRCAIAVGADHRGVFLRITNDGAQAAAGEDPGTGLTGLRERLAVVGGTLGAQRDGEDFVLEARVPHPDAAHDRDPDAPPVTTAPPASLAPPVTTAPTGGSR